MPVPSRVVLLSLFIASTALADDPAHRHFQDRRKLSDGGSMVTSDLDLSLDGDDWLVQLHCDVENRLLFVGVRGTCTATLRDGDGATMSTLRADVDEAPACGLSCPTLRGQTVRLRMPAYGTFERENGQGEHRHLIDIRSVEFTEYLR